MSDVIEDLMFCSRSDFAKIIRHYRKIHGPCGRLIYKRTVKARQEFGTWPMEKGGPESPPPHSSSSVSG